MKKIQNSKSVAAAGACCSRRQKIYGVIALGGLFACGLMVGLAINGGRDDGMKKIEMSASQCESIASEIVYLGTRATNPNMDKLRELNELYSANCAGRLVVVETAAPVSQQQVQEISEQIAEKPTCVVIEETLSGRLLNNPGDNSYNYLRNADIYANMMENGCPENAEKYKAAALRSLEIAQALQYNNEVIDNAEIVIDTYKKLDMQNQAREFLNKVQKLTDPAIDFILKMEQIINE